MDPISLQLEAPAGAVRWLPLFRLLGFIGLIALSYGGPLREQTGRQELIAKDGTVFVGHIETWNAGAGSLTPNGYLLENGEVEGGAGLVQTQEEIVLRTAPGPEGRPIENGTVERYRLARVKESREAPTYPGGPNLTWKKIATLDGKEGFTAGTLSTEMSKQSSLRLYVRAEDARRMAPEVRYRRSGIALIPLRLLLLFAPIWLLHLPAFVLLIAYQVAAVPAFFLNLLHILIFERNHRDLTQYLVRVANYRLKFLVSLLGTTGVIPHVDIHSREAKALPFRFAARIDDAVPRLQALWRLMLALFPAVAAKWMDLFVLPAGWMGTAVMVVAGLLAAILLLPAITYGIVQIALWITIGAVAKAPRILLDIEGRILRLWLTVELFLAGIATSPSVFKQAIVSPLTRSAPGRDQFDPGPGAKVEIPLLVLLLLVVGSFGLYTLCWIGRTAKALGDEPFTILLITVFGGTLPLSFLLSRYYRRSEILQRTNPSILVELLMMIPGLHLLLGPFVIQYGLNAVARSQAKTEAG